MNERNAGTGPKRWVSAFFVPRHILFINLVYKKIREEVLRLSVCVGIC